MAAIAGLPPETVRDILVAQGWIVIDETENAWLLADGNDPQSAPLPLSKHGDVVDPEVMDWLMHQVPGVRPAIVRAVGAHVAPAKPPTP
jgi:hypothetical protein